MSDDIAVEVKNIRKTFKLPHEKNSSVKSALINVLKGKRTYETQKVLKGISFEVKKGEFFGVVGRNGSGKSTLLKLLAGIYTPDSGQINVKGKLTPFIELGVGFNPELTGRENVFLNGALLGFSRKEMQKMYTEIVEFAELEKFMDQKLKNYSSGMQVRLAFSIAIRANTDILVLDEVLAVGDSAFQDKCKEYFKKIKKSETTVILVTHDMESVKEFCERALLLDNGNIRLVDNPYTIAEAYEEINLSLDNKNDKLLAMDDVITAEAELTQVSLGNGEGKKISKKIVKKGDEIKITMTYVLVADIENATADVGLRAGKNGAYYFYRKSQEKISAKKGQKVVVECIVENIFNESIFYIAASLFDQKSLHVYARNRHAAKIKTELDRESGMILPKHNLSVKVL